MHRQLRSCVTCKMPCFPDLSCCGCRPCYAPISMQPCEISFKMGFMPLCNLWVKHATARWHAAASSHHLHPYTKRTNSTRVQMASYKSLHKVPCPVLWFVGYVCAYKQHSTCNVLPPPLWQASLSAVVHTRKGMKRRHGNTCAG